MKLWPAVALLAILAACHSSHTPLEDRVFAAVADAWQAAGLRDPYADRHRRLEDFRIEVAPTAEAYAKSCPVRSWACQRWRYAPGRVRSIMYPVAIINPLLPSDRHAAVAVHELCHAFQLTAYHRVDYEHADQRVWRPSPDSVEARAQLELYGTE